MKTIFPLIFILFLCAPANADLIPLSIEYSVHMADKGWGDWEKDGSIAGTTGESRQLEAIKIRLAGAPNESKEISCEVTYRAHIANLGWLPWVRNGAIAGTTGQHNQLEAMEIKLLNCEGWNVLYRAHIAESGWLSSTTDGGLGGTTGQDKAMEAIKIQLLPQGCGEKWQGPLNNPTNNWLRDIAWNQEMWVTTGDGGSILTSTDGLNWQPQSSSKNDSINSIKWNGKYWLAIGGGYSNHFILISQDGINWEQRYTSTKGPLGAIKWDGKNWYVLASEHIVILTSDGLKWQEFSHPNYSLFNDIELNQNTWVATSYYGNIIASTDGVNWERQTYSLKTRVSPPEIYKTLNDLDWNGEQWIAVGSSYYKDGLVSTILTSPDGFNWKKQPSALGKELYAVKWNGHQWIAVGGIHNHQSYESTILSSVDGYHWQKQYTDSKELLYNIQWNGYQWITTGTNGTILSSADGIDWQKHTINSLSSLTELAWNGRQWITAGSNGEIFSSTCKNNNNICISESAHYDELAGLLHIKNLKVEGLFGSSQQYQNISLRYIENSNPIAFNPNFLDTPQSHQLCSEETIVLSQDGLLTVPSVQYTSKVGVTSIYNNLTLQLDKISNTLQLQNK